MIKRFGQFHTVIVTDKFKVCVSCIGDERQLINFANGPVHRCEQADQKNHAPSNEEHARQAPLDNDSGKGHGDRREAGDCKHEHAQDSAHHCTFDPLLKPGEELHVEEGGCAAHYKQDGG